MPSLVKNGLILSLEKNFLLHVIKSNVHVCTFSPLIPLREEHGPSFEKIGSFKDAVFQVLLQLVP